MVVWSSGTLFPNKPNDRSGEALEWYQFWKQCKPFNSWPELSEERKNKFGSTQMRMPLEKLISLEETGTEVDYKE